jgi:hypothetical protein
MTRPLTRAEAARLPWYPVVLVAAYVLTLWIDSGVSFWAIWRSLAVSVIAVGAALILIASVTRRPHVAAAIVIAAVAVLASRGVSGVAATAILLLAIPLALVLWARIRRTPVSMARMTATMNTISLLILGIVLLGGIPRGSYAALLSTDLHQGASALPSTQHLEGDTASILVVLLDGYPRADVLEESFDFDDAPFLGELEARGFTVGAESTSNYPYTQATLISMFHMRPLTEISALDAVEAGEEAPYPRMRQVANNNPVFDELRKHGYMIVTSSPGYEHVTLREADVFLDNGALNEPERHLIRGTTLQSLIDLLSPHALADQHRQRIIASLDTADEIGARLAEDGPIYAFLHVPSPHMPVVLGRDGELLADPPSDGEFRSEPVTQRAKQAYVGQLIYLNERTLGVIDRALSGNPENEPIIIVMSDHGAAPPALDGESWTADHFANFLAIRTPASLDLQLPLDTTPVNLYPRLFEAMFGSEFPEWPETPYPWVDVPIAEDGGQ